jgi:uncharacterized membrane protein HdeD (DUF308 family)
MSLIPTGPDYSFVERWPARIGRAFLLMPFFALAYILGSAVDWALPDTDFDGWGGLIAMGMFGAMVGATLVADWYRPFRS